MGGTKDHTKLPVPKDYGLEVGKGNVPGHSNVQIIGRNSSVGTTYEDLWDVGGFSTPTNTLVYPVAGETWEIVSVSVNDTAAGTGAQLVLVTYLDDNYTEQIEIKTMNGTVAVVFTATDAFRFRSAIVLSVGSTGWNEGQIQVQASVAGAARGGIDYGNGIGLNASLDFHYTVAVGFTFFPQLITSNVTKNDDVQIRSMIRLFGSDVFFTVAEIGNYQNVYTQDVSMGPSGVPEKSDFKIIARSSNASVTAIASVVGKLIDNRYI